MNRNQPRIDILTAVYRNPEVLAAVESVRSQTYPNTRHCLIDGSALPTFSEEISKRIPADVTHMVEPDGGIYHALNKGLRIAAGDIVGLLHSDDVFADDYTLSQVAAVFSEKRVDVVYGDLEYRSKGRVIRHWQAGGIRKAKIAAGWMPPHPTVFMRTEVVNRVGLYDTRFRIAGDYEYLLRLMLDHELKIAYLPRVITKMKIGGASNGSLKRLLRKSIEDVWAMRMHGLNPYIALPLKVLSKLPQFLGVHHPPSVLLRLR